MRNTLKYIILVIITGSLSLACSNKTEQSINQQQGNLQNEVTSGDKTVRLTARQQKAIGLELGYLEFKNLKSAVKVSGQLELPPQYQAKVNTFVKGNVKEINVIEGDYVRKGQSLATLEHPDLIDLQRNFQQLDGSLDYLREEYLRKKTLYDGEVSSAKDYQKAQAEYKSTLAHYKGLKEKLRLLGMNPQKVAEGEFSASIAIRSPIEGYIKAVYIQTGEYVSPQKEMFEVINNQHVHVDFKVFEKDIYKVKKGQKINFTVPNLPGEILQAEVFSIGKNVEDNPKAIHLHADITTLHESLLPGMYVSGRLLVDEHRVLALPEEAIVEENRKKYIFVKSDKKGAIAAQEDSATTYRRIEITTGPTDLGYTAVHLLQPLADSVLAVVSGAYYLQADLNKGENEHSH